MALMPTERMGPPPGALPPMRMTASWSGSERTDRIQVCGARSAPNGELPSDPPQTRHLRRRSYAPVAVHHPSVCSGVKALRNTSAARRQAAKLCYRFGPLTPSARSANLIAGDGTKNGFPAPNKEPAKSQKRLLDRKSPIQVRIRFPSAASQQRTSRQVTARRGGAPYPPSRESRLVHPGVRREPQGAPT